MKKNQLVIVAIVVLFSTTARAQKLFELMDTDGVHLKEVQDEATSHFGKVGTGKGTGYEVFKRWEHHAQSNLQSDGTLLRQEAHVAAIQHSKNMASSNGKKLISTSDWTELGPLSMTRGNSGNSPGMGRVTAIYVEPELKQIIYVGSPGGGLWKSSNGGNSWIPLGDQFENMFIWAIEGDANDTDIVYIGNSTGELQKSTDGGFSFTTILDSTGILTDILLNPNNPEEVYVALANNGLYHTANGGSSWTKVINADIEDVQFKPGSTTTIYACGDDFYRSTDSGTSFTKITNGIDVSHRMRLAVTPADSNYVYVVQKGDTGFGYLYRSTDSGASFTVQSTRSEVDYIGIQAVRNMAIMVSDTDANEVHMGGLHMYKSIDGGVSFTKKTSGSTAATINSDILSYVHADIEVMHYVNGALYVGCHGGIYKSTDAADSFVDLSEGIGIHQFYTLASSPTNKNVIIGGSHSNGSVIKSGASTQWMQYFSGNGADCMIDPNDENIIYGSYQFGGLGKSIDGGFNTVRSYVRTPENAKGVWLTPLAIDSNNGSRIYAGYSQLYRHDNAGISGDWTNASENITFSAKLSHIRLCPSDSDVIYVGTHTSLYKSTNITSASPTWILLPQIPDGGIITDIAVDHYDKNRVAYVTAKGFVVLSTDGGANWTRIDEGLPVTSVRTMIFDRSPDKGMYIGINGVIFYKSNSVPNWTVFSDNLPNVDVKELDLYYDKEDQEASRIRAATFGRGLWESPLYDTRTTDENSCESYGANAYTTIQAEDFCDQQGIEIGNDGTTVGYIEDGDYIAFEAINFSTNGAVTFETRVSSNLSGGTIEIRLDDLSGPLVGTCNIGNTGSWNTWINASCDINGPTGNHDVYLIFTGGDGFLFDIDSFEFKELSLSTPTNTESTLSKIALFPNPAQTTLYIQLPTMDENVEVTISNLLGQAMRKQTFNTNHGLNPLKMNIEDFVPGLYTVTILKGQAKIIKTMVVQK